MCGNWGSLYYEEEKLVGQDDEITNNSFQQPEENQLGNISDDIAEIQNIQSTTGKDNFVDITEDSEDDEGLNEFMSTIIKKATKDLVPKSYNRALVEIAKMEEIERELEKKKDSDFIVKSDKKIGCSLCGVHKDLSKSWSRKDLYTRVFHFLLADCPILRN